MEDTVVSYFVICDIEIPWGTFEILKETFENH